MSGNGLEVLDQLPIPIFSNPSASTSAADQKYLTDTCINALQISSQIARNSEQFFPALMQVFTARKLCAILKSETAVIRAKACNLIGNLCRHSDRFYSTLLDSSDLDQGSSSPSKRNLAPRTTVIDLLTDCCSDPDASTRKFSSFASKLFFRLLYLLLILIC